MRVMPRARGLEMTTDAAMAGRVRRQMAISTLALGVIWVLVATGGDAHGVIVAALAAGWVLMPALLGLSLRRPRLRYGLIVPAGLISAGLLGLVLTALPDDAAERIGWLLTTAGVLSGGVLGSWFWYRMLPVPKALDPPVAPGRWALIAGHVFLVVAGIILVTLGRLG
jgi:hypothetical protein